MVQNVGIDKYERNVNREWGEIFYYSPDFCIFPFFLKQSFFVSHKVRLKICLYEQHCTYYVYKYYTYIM